MLINLLFLNTIFSKFKILPYIFLSLSLINQTFSACDRENKQYVVTNYCLIQKLGIDYWEQLKFQKLKKTSQMDLDIIYK